MRCKLCLLERRKAPSAFRFGPARDQAEEPRRLPRGIALGALTATFVLVALFGAGAASAATNRGGAVTTTIDTSGNYGPCLNGPGLINCNLYQSKGDVFLSGGPDNSASGLPNGDYFFAILDPGVQNGGVKDGAAGNLSDTVADPSTGTYPGDLGSGDTVYDRKFNLNNGVLTNLGTHVLGTHTNGGVTRPVIQATPDDDTSNRGGVYILAVCKWQGGPHPSDAPPSTCKYDAFKCKPKPPPPPPATPLIVTKDANPSFKRTFKWDISKAVDRNRINTPSGTSATFNYTIGVTKDTGTDSDWEITGTIQVFNPNDGAVTGVNVSDKVEVNNLDPNCSLDGNAGTNATIPANSDVDFPYTCIYQNKPDPSSGTNTATATWPAQAVGTSGGLAAGSASGTFNFVFDTGVDPNPTLVDSCVSVTDTVDGVPSTLDDPLCASKTYTPARTFDDPAGTCTTHNNTASFETKATGTTGSASRSVKVCVGKDLAVSKDATPSFRKKFTWGINLNVDKTLVTQVGGNATFNYTVNVTRDAGAPRNWQVDGKITVSNPNDWEAVTVDVGDAIDDPNATCTVTGGNNATIPASGSKTFDYSCAYSAAPQSGSETNTATATWDKGAFYTPHGSKTGTAPVDWAGTTPTLVDSCVSVTDTVDGVPSTLDDPLCASKTYTPARTFDDPAGTCTTHNNTASFETKATGTTGSASRSVKVCVGKDLAVSKDATPSFRKKFTWGINLNVDKTLVTQVGGNATFNYTVNVTRDAGAPRNWQVDGKITVSNPNDWEAVTVDVGDAIDDPNATCTVTGGNNATIPASGSKTFDYSCAYSAAPQSGSETNTATATWDKGAFYTPHGSKTGTAPVDWAGTTPTLVDECVNVSDTYAGSLGQPCVLGANNRAPSSLTTFNFSRTVPVPALGCKSYDNTAKFTTNDSKTTGDASQSVKVCTPPAPPPPPGLQGWEGWHDNVGAHCSARVQKPFLTPSQQVAAYTEVFCNRPSAVTVMSRLRANYQFADLTVAQSGCAAGRAECVQHLPRGFTYFYLPCPKSVVQQHNALYYTDILLYPGTKIKQSYPFPQRSRDATLSPYCLS